MTFLGILRYTSIISAAVSAWLLIGALGAAAKTVSQTEHAEPDLRVETIPVAGGAELITIFAKQSAFREKMGDGSAEIPLLSILRDTLGDGRKENDKLRFVWMLTYAKPSFWQKATAFVPFLYSRTGNKGKVGTSPPPPIADMQTSDKALWNKILWFAFRKVVLDQAGVGPRASVLQYRQNAGDYRRSAIASALTVLNLYQKVEGEKVLTDTELRDIQARLWLNDDIFGGMMQDENLERVYEKRSAAVEDNRGHNWELLRQYAESQGLYFEPIIMPDGSATHAMVWTTAEDVREKKGAKFDKRFLNIRSPWNDADLMKWSGYSQERWLGPDGLPTSAGTPNAVKKTFIPLALYGLDTEKIPGILIDFRDTRNAKRREMSRRVLNDVAGNVLAVSPITNIPYMVGRRLYDIVTGRKGVDINQASRVRSYAQLKMLLALDESLDHGLRGELAARIEDVSLNPLENDVDVEARIARQQYRNLIAYARRPDGLPAKLDRDRREEMVKLVHSGKKQALYTLGHFLSLGIYTHREKATPELVAKMDAARQLRYHERVLNELAYRSVRPEIDSDTTELRNALAYLSENASAASSKTAKSLSKIFRISSDEDTRRLCLTALYKVDNSTAKAELLAIYNDQKVETEWRELSAQFLKRSVAEGKRVSHQTAAGIAVLTGD